MNLWLPWALLPVVWYAAYVDFRTHKIPNRLVYPALILFGGVQMAIQPHRGAFLVGMVAGFLFFFLPSLILGAKFVGMGDAKLAALMGVTLGWPGILLAILISQFTALVIAAPLLLLKRLTWKSSLPLGPFLAVGYTLVLVGVHLWI